MIRRRGRWKSLTSHQYIWRDATALNTLPEVIVKPHGYPNRLKLVNKEPKCVSFQQTCETMSDPKVDISPAKAGVTTDLFPPDDRSKAGSSRPGSRAGLDSFVFSSSDFPAYADSPTDNAATFQGTRPLTKREKRGWNLRNSRVETKRGRWPK